MSGNFFEELKKVFRAAPQPDCLRLPGGATWSFADLTRSIERVAGVLCDCGVVAGDRVVAQVDKSPEALALYLATLQVGGIYVPLNTAYTSAETDYFLDDAEPAVFVKAPDREQGGPAGRLRRNRDSLRVLTLGADGEGTLAQAMDGADLLQRVIPRDAPDIAVIVYTSGTTGRAKGAMLSHANLASNANALCNCWGWREDDVLLHALPIFHVHGLFIALHCALLSGTPTIFLPRFDAGEVVRLLPESTVMMGVPTFYSRMLGQPEFSAGHCARMRLFISGSAPLTEQTFHAWQAHTGHRIVERYGMSETIISTSNPLDGDRVAGTVGFALPGVAVRVADAAGNEVPRDAVGMIEIRGENVFDGYWRMPDKTAQEFRPDGFFISGDLGTMDAEGRVRIVGRGKDLIISGGYNVYPREVETEIDALDGVVESAVIGVPHPDFGEAVVAVLVPAGAPVEEPVLRAALASRLARFKQPKKVVNVAQLPRNAMGKVQKNRLREDYGALFCAMD